MIMGEYRTLLAYKKAFELAMQLFEISKGFPREEKFGLIAQIRNSSRSVCANIAEAYKRKRYKDYYISKLNDSETENTETEVWLNFALACGYIEVSLYQELKSKNDEVGKLIWYMIHNPQKFL